VRFNASQGWKVKDQRLGQLNGIIQLRHELVAELDSTKGVEPCLHQWRINRYGRQQLSRNRN
jgi:hypothetical protein